LSYINELARNVRGGRSQETADADQIYLGGSLDLHRLVGLPGAKIIFSLTDRNGESLSVKAHLNTLLEVQEIYGEGNYTRLNQLYWEQQLFGKTLELKLGRMTGTFDFMPFSCKFQNITFCATLQSHGVVTNWVAFPGSTWAALARVNLKKDWYLQAGAPRTRSGPISRSGACHNLAAAHRVQAAGKVSFVKNIAALCKIRNEFVLMLRPKVCKRERQCWSAVFGST
jgi:porin